jgi:hypothetical protein
MSHAPVAVRRSRRHVGQLRRRRPIRDKPSGYQRFSTLATNPVRNAGSGITEDPAFATPLRPGRRPAPM